MAAIGLPESTELMEQDSWIDILFVTYASIHSTKDKQKEI